MKENKNKSIDWENMQGKVAKILGEDFWSEINNIIPKRGPSVDTYKADDKFVVVVEAAGIENLNNIRIRLHGDLLIVSGKIPWIYPVTYNELIKNERFTGEFEREIQLPHNIKREGKIDAKYKNGLLEICIPMDNSGEEKYINIEFDE